jgi:hypothetical protein
MEMFQRERCSFAIEPPGEPGVVEADQESSSRNRLSLAEKEAHQRMLDGLLSQQRIKCFVIEFYMFYPC